ncbi:hypothetical protein [Mucilaginibacter sp.]|uniref:hypothetical protein n=1 Tax=Mucilaginibacter sp. TaxID=1882438 RepID=UPI0025E305E5|nr:hypothetical protein [Mucilaginibacter sp.]
MNREYPISPGWKIVVYITIAAAFAGGIYLYTTVPPTDKLLHFLVATFLVSWAVYLGVYVKRKRVIITPNSIIDQAVFTSKELQKTEINGYKIVKDNLIFEVDKPAKSLYISNYTTLVNSGEILVWASQFKVIFAKKYQNEFDAMLHDEAIGSTPKERKLNIARAKKLSVCANYIGIAIAIWVFAYPHPYKYAMVSGLVYPLLVIGLFYAKRDIMIFGSDISGSSGGKESVYPNLTSALIAAPFALLFRVIYDWDLLSYMAIFLPALVIAVVLCVVFVFILNDANIKTRSNEFTKFNIVCFVLLYSGVATITTNCEFDNAPARIYKTTILDKRYTTGKHSAYYLTIDKWGAKQKSDEITVSRDFYNRVSTGQAVKVNTMPGLLRIPWFYVDQ